MIARFPALLSSARRRARPIRRPLSGTLSPTPCHMARRPPAPPYWQNIAPRLRATPCTTGPHRQRYWLLVLQAKRIRYLFFDRGRFPSLFVPPIAARTALHEILAFERERPAPPLPQPMQRKGLYWYPVLLAFLILWHRLRWNGPPGLFPLPEKAGDWVVLAGLDAYRITAVGEWWRAVTSLTLHADAAHLLANFVMGIVFGIPLCRHTGVGLGFLLTLLAGSLGNVATAYLRPASFISQGFSTAVFASVGLLSMFAAAFAARHAARYATGSIRRIALKHGVLQSLVPLGAGLGILAMLGGSDAPNVDYLAHSMGLAAGILVGLGIAVCAPRLLVLRGTHNVLLQAASLTLAACLLISAWLVALPAQDKTTGHATRLESVAAPVFTAGQYDRTESPDSITPMTAYRAGPP